MFIILTNLIQKVMVREKFNFKKLSKFYFQSKVTGINISWFNYSSL